MGWIGEDNKQSGNALQTVGSMLFINASTDRLNLDVE